MGICQTLIPTGRMVLVSHEPDLVAMSFVEEIFVDENSDSASVPCLSAR